MGDQKIEIFLACFIKNTEKNTAGDTEFLNPSFFAVSSVTYVTDELENAPEVKRDEMMRLIPEYGIAVLAPNEEAVRMTILATGKINKLNGYRAIEIYSPMEVVEDENT